MEKKPRNILIGGLILTVIVIIIVIVMNQNNAKVPSSKVVAKNSGNLGAKTGTGSGGKIPVGTLPDVTNSGNINPSIPSYVQGKSNPNYSPSNTSAVGSALFSNSLVSSGNPVNEYSVDGNFTTIGSEPNSGVYLGIIIQDGTDEGSTSYYKVNDDQGNDFYVSKYVTIIQAI